MAHNEAASVCHPTTMPSPPRDNSPSRDRWPALGPLIFSGGWFLLHSDGPFWLVQCHKDEGPHTARRSDAVVLFPLPNGKKENLYLLAQPRAGLKV